MSDEFPQELQAWKPTCSADIFGMRFRTRRLLQEFFGKQGYLEVETPLLSHDVVVDSHLEPFAVHTGNKTLPMYLQTSPEAAMKRLLAAGSGSIYQVTRSFRQGESGTRHNPEFTMLEWYGVESTYHDQMDLTEQLIHFLVKRLTTFDHYRHKQKLLPWLADSCMKQPFASSTYDEAFRSALGRTVLDATITDLRLLVVNNVDGMQVDQLPNDRDALLNLLLAECVEPNLGIEQPEFLFDYPISQAALAEQNPHDDRTACRFELYCNGIELCNGYQELVDVQELQRREAAQNAARVSHAAEELPGAKFMQAAMQSGLPKCSGVALGFDRLLMCLTGADSIADVIPFPFDRA